MDSSQDIKFESARMAEPRVVYDPAKWLERFTSGQLSEREKRYAESWSEETKGESDG